MTDRIASIRERIAASRAKLADVRFRCLYCDMRWSVTNPPSGPVHVHVLKDGTRYTKDIVMEYDPTPPAAMSALLADLEAALAVVEAAKDVQLCGAGTQSMARLDATLSTFDTP